jgi:hypothetical protein
MKEPGGSAGLFLSSKGAVADTVSGNAGLFFIQRAVLDTASTAGHGP